MDSDPANHAPMLCQKPRTSLSSASVQSPATNQSRNTLYSLQTLQISSLYQTLVGIAPGRGSGLSEVISDPTSCSPCSQTPIEVELWTYQDLQIPVRGLRSDSVVSRACQ